jgi:hypothetical protein
MRRPLAEHRLVTVIGPGGVGKTALAREASRELGASHPLAAPFWTRADRRPRRGSRGEWRHCSGFPSFDALLDAPTDQPALRRGRQLRARARRNCGGDRRRPGGVHVTHGLATPRPILPMCWTHEELAPAAAAHGSHLTAVCRKASE